MYYLIKKLKYFQEFSSKNFRNFKSVFEIVFEFFNNNYGRFCRISDPFEYLTIFILYHHIKISLFNYFYINIFLIFIFTYFI